MLMHISSVWYALMVRASFGKSTNPPIKIKMHSRQEASERMLSRYFEKNFHREARLMQLSSTRSSGTMTEPNMCFKREKDPTIPVGNKYASLE